MPLARIVTRFPESSLAASEYLRSRGYTVEVVDPGEFRVTPAVLELKLGKCSQEEALRRVQELLHEMESPKPASASPLQAEEIEEPAEAVAYDITGRPVEFAERRKAPNSFGGALLSLLRRAWDDTSSRLPELMRVFKAGGTRNTIMDRAETGPTSRQPLPVRDTIATKSSSDADVLARAAAEREAAEREHRARIAAARDAAEGVRVRLQRESEAAAERERQRIAAAREAELARQREQERIAAQRAAEERDRLQREAKAAAEREHQRIAAMREAELVREQQQLAAQRAAQEEQDRARAAELATPHKHDGALAQQAIIPSGRQRALSSAQAADEFTKKQGALPATVPPVASFRRRKAAYLPPGGWEGRLNPIREREWKKAFAAAGMVAVLGVAGIIAFANRRPASPLSDEELMRSRSIDQQTPFGSATITPPQPATPQTAKPAATPTIQKPAPVHHTVTNSASGRRRPANSATGGRLRQSSPEDEQVANDQVLVRHFQKPQPILKSAKTTSVKQISD